MKKLVLVALAAAAFSAGSASAQYPPPQYAPAPYGPGAPAPYGPGGPVVATSQPGCSTCGTGEAVPSHMGFHPFLRKFFGLGGGLPQRQVLPAAQPGQGQLAFPQNPFIRSPRDFFMY